MALVESNLMPEGTELIPFSLPDIHGKDVSSSDFEQSPLLLIVFTCNHCPYAVASWPVLIELQNRYQSDGLQIIAINPNNNPEYPDDAFARMKPFAQKTGVNFPYLFDGEQTTARAYGAVCTPDPFLFHRGKLFYHGRLTDNWQKPELVQEHSMDLNIQAALGRIGEAPSRTFPSMGCSIKWIR